jgi:hypothetical protein
MLVCSSNVTGLLVDALHVCEFGREGVVVLELEAMPQVLPFLHDG